MLCYNRLLLIVFKMLCPFFPNFYSVQQMLHYLNNLELNQ